MAGMLRCKDQAEFDALLKRSAARVHGDPVEARALIAKTVSRPIRSELEVTLQEQIEEAGLPTPEYDKPYLIGTRHRLDVLWRGIKFGVEVQGMAHRIKGKFKADIHKRAIGLLQGWTVLEVDGDTIRSGQAIEWIKILLNDRQRRSA